MTKPIRVIFNGQPLTDNHYTAYDRKKRAIVRVTITDETPMLCDVEGIIYRGDTRLSRQKLATDAITTRKGLQKFVREWVRSNAPTGDPIVSVPTRADLQLTLTKLDLEIAASKVWLKQAAIALIEAQGDALSVALTEALITREKSVQRRDKRKRLKVRKQLAALV